MKRRLLVIDTARGGFVIEDAFVRALKANQISGAGFHVATQKPLPVDHPFNEIQNHPASYSHRASLGPAKKRYSRL